MINDEDYWECVDDCQRMGAELASLEDLLFEEPGLEGDTLASRVEELLNIKFMYDGLCK